LVQPGSPVLVPLDNGVFVIRPLNSAEFSGGPSKIAQALDAITGNHFRVGDRTFAKRRLLRTI
jgi:hypothetical protein